MNKTQHRSLADLASLMKQHFCRVRTLPTLQRLVQDFILSPGPLPDLPEASDTTMDDIPSLSCAV